MSWKLREEILEDTGNEDGKGLRGAYANWNKKKEEGKNYGINIDALRNSFSATFDIYSIIIFVII